MGWGQYLSIAFTQLGVSTAFFRVFATFSHMPQVEQTDLGVSGGLSGVARNGGGVVALTVCTTILANVQSSSMKKLVPSAAIQAGLPPTSVEALLSALPLGAAAISEVPGITEPILATALAAFQQSFVVALRYVASLMTTFIQFRDVIVFQCRTRTIY